MREVKTQTPSANLDVRVSGEWGHAWDRGVQAIRHSVCGCEVEGRTKGSGSLTELLFSTNIKVRVSGLGHNALCCGNGDGW